MESLIDENEQKIMRELIVNPRISDNQISKNTKVPLISVNRKRKKLEQKGILNYFTSVNNSPIGTNAFEASHMYVVELNHGISRVRYLEVLSGLEKDIYYLSKHIMFSYISENDGKVVHIMMLTSRKESDIIEIFNVEIVNKLKPILGNDCIGSVKVYNIQMPLRVLHNYIFIPGKSNLKNGVIDPNFNKDLIFVC